MNSWKTFFSRIEHWLMANPLGRSQWIALTGWLVVVAIWMVMLGNHIAGTTNQDMEHSDQKAYLLVTLQNRKLVWPEATDGIRNPLFPWLLAHTARGKMPALFVAGKALNIRCGALVLLAFGIWAGRRFAWLPAVTFSTIAGLGVLLPISTYVGAEVLYYGLFFFAWMTAFALLARLTWFRCALLGFLLALAYLAKPGVTLFCGCLALVVVGRWIFSRHSSTTSDDGWNGWRPLAGAAVAIAVAAPMVLPRALHAQERFGDPFQNTATRCFWEDDWDACLPKLNHLNPREIDQIKPEDRPSLRRYFSKHSLGDAFHRLTNGMAMQFDNLMGGGKKSLYFSLPPSEKRPVKRVFPYRGWMLVPPGLLVLILLAANFRSRSAPRFTPTTVSQLAFTVLLLGVSFAAFGWYYPISPGARFVMALYLPALAILGLVGENLRLRLGAVWSDRASRATWTVMLVVFLAHMVIISRHPEFTELRTAF